MLAISSFMFLIVGLYLDAVLPKAYGERHNLCCCFTRWFNSRQQVHFEDDADFEAFEHKYLEQESCESVPR